MIYWIITIIVLIALIVTAKIASNKYTIISDKIEKICNVCTGILVLWSLVVLLLGVYSYLTFGREINPDNYETLLLKKQEIIRGNNVVKYVIEITAFNNILESAQNINSLFFLEWSISDRVNAYVPIDLSFMEKGKK